MTVQIMRFYSVSFALALSFSLISCTANTPEMTSLSPKKTVAVQTTAPNLNSDQASSLEHRVSLSLIFKGSALLQDFTLQQTQDICLPELKSIETILTLPESLSEETAFQLKAQGMKVEGAVVKINTKMSILAELSSVEALIKGLEVIVPDLPQGKIKAESHLNNIQGNSMGSLNYEFDLLEKNKQVQVFFQTNQPELTPNGCTSLTANLTGANLISTSGGLLEGVVNPVKENPKSSSKPAPILSMPARLQLEFSSKYLTALGETQQLKLVLFDELGQAVSLDAYELEWFSSRPQDISVDKNGLLIAQVGGGYAEIGVRIIGSNLEEKALFDISDPSFFSKPSKKRSSGSSSGSNQESSDEFSAPDYGFLSRNFNMWMGSNTDKAMYKVSQIGELSLIADTSTTLPDFSEGQAGGILSTGDKVYSFFKVNGDTEWHLYTIDFITGEATFLKAFDNPAIKPGGGAPYNGGIYFIVSTIAEGNELWKTDGTPEGTVLVKDINTNGGNAFDPNNSSNMVIYNGFLYFGANNGSDGVELWKTDGSSNGTVQVANINAAGASSEPREMQVVGDYLYFFANNGSNDGVMYELDRTDNLRTVINESNVYIQGGELLGQKFYFHTGGSVQNPAQIHVWDQAGKTLNSITAVDPDTHKFEFLGNVSGKIYFLAQNTQTNNVDLYSTQGTNETTQIEDNVITDNSGTDLQSLAQQLNNKIFVSFQANGNAAYQMYLLDTSGFRNVSTYFTDQVTGGSGSYDWAFFGDNRADVSSYNADRIYLTLMDANNQKHTYFYSEGTAESTVKLGESVDMNTAQTSGDFATIASVFGFTYHMYYSNMELPSYGLPKNTDKVYFTLGFQ